MPDRICVKTAEKPVAVKIEEGGGSALRTQSPNYSHIQVIRISLGLTSRDTPSPVDPDTVEVLMTFEPDPADLALSSIPGHETFDPRRHRFSEEELKPQPIMKKARKVQVPEEQKVSMIRCGLGLAQSCEKLLPLRRC